jgi:hypothetical protein
VKRLATPLMAVAIFLLNVWLNAPLFTPGELPFRGSIEDSYVAMARFIAQHPDPWGWNPFVYCGIATGHMYVPLVPYTTALGIHLLPHLAPDFIYRTLVSLATCAGPVALFFFALYFTGSRWWAFGTAIAYSLFSPSYGLFPAVEKDRGIVQLPWRIQVLAKYGEGPHNVGLSLLPLALLAVWRTGQKRGYPRLLLAAVLLALVPLANWIAALTLGICCVLLLAAAWREPGFSIWRPMMAAGLAYLLALFWLTPEFIYTIQFNWPQDSFAYHLRAPQAWLLGGMAAGAAAIWLLFRYFRGSFYFCFVAMAAFVFGWISTAYYVGGIDTIPESRRYAIEFELFLALAAAEGLRLALRSTNQTVRMSAMGVGGMMLLAGLPQLWAYSTQDRRLWMPAPPESTVEYRLAEWIAKHPPAGRVFASGGLRFRLNTWFDIPQVGGGFETGLRNRNPWELSYRIRTGRDLRPGQETADTLAALRALGAEYVVVHGPKSKEYYRDFLKPERVAGLAAVFRVDDDTVYQLPPRGLAHVLRPDEVAPADVRHNPEALARYTRAVEDAARPALRVEWAGARKVRIGGTVGKGEVVSAQISAAPGWRAEQDGRAVPIEEDGLGFMVLRTEAGGESRIELTYHGTTGQRVWAGVSALAWVCALGGLWADRGVRRRPGGLPHKRYTGTV